MTPNYYVTTQRLPVVDRRRPGEGFRHALLQKDIHRFIEILPDWDELSKELDAIVLAPGLTGVYGYHTPGVVHIRAWERDLRHLMSPEFFQHEREKLERLGVPWDKYGSDVQCHFTEATVRAYQLLYVLTHELGHHHDYINTRSRVVARGEPYAYAYEKEYADRIWDRFLQNFTLD